ncbi:hypothetical protein EI94DRAFT_1722566 [Lactarius quietus]|nr:hypothetical protein EI94DRAFT_1722566 [Lactarius quietus]
MFFFGVARVVVIVQFVLYSSGALVTPHFCRARHIPVAKRRPSPRHSQNYNIAVLSKTRFTQYPQVIHIPLEMNERRTNGMTEAIMEIMDGSDHLVYAQPRGTSAK